MPNETYQRPMFGPLLKRIQEERRFIQILAGPRQAGKTTLARQVMDAVGVPTVYATADYPSGRDAGWLRLRCADSVSVSRTGPWGPPGPVLGTVGARAGLVLQRVRSAWGFSGQKDSYAEMLAPRGDARNTATLARCLRPRAGAGMVTALSK